MKKKRFLSAVFHVVFIVLLFATVANAGFFLIDPAPETQNLYHGDLFNIKFSDDMENGIFFAIANVSSKPGC
jgi:hypothetical protein